MTPIDFSSSGDLLGGKSGVRQTTPDFDDKVADSATKAEASADARTDVRAERMPPAAPAQHAAVPPQALSSSGDATGDLGPIIKKLEAVLADLKARAGISTAALPNPIGSPSASKPSAARLAYARWALGRPGSLGQGQPPFDGTLQ